MKKAPLILTMVFVCAAMNAQNTATIKLNPEKNKIYKFHSVSEQDITQTINGVEQNSSNFYETVLSFKMVDATKEFFIVEIRFDSIKSKINSGGKITEMSSVNEGKMASSEVSDVMNAVLNRLSKNSLFVKIDPAGKLNDILNYTMVSQMLLKDTVQITGATASTIKAQAVNAVSFIALKSMIEMFTNHLPGAEVKQGEEWKKSSDINSGGMALTIATNYKLKALNADKAEISGESSINPSINAEPMEYSGAKITYDNIAGMSKSSVQLDINSGLIVSSNSQTQIAGTLYVSVQGMNLEIPMKVNGTAKIESLL